MLSMNPHRLPRTPLPALHRRTRGGDNLPVIAATPRLHEFRYLQVEVLKIPKYSLEHLSFLRRRLKVLARPHYVAIRP